MPTKWSCPPLAPSVWSLAEQNFTYRVVLDLSPLPILHTALIGQFVHLQKRICTHDGVLRLCGLIDHNRMVLQSCRLDGYFPIFIDRDRSGAGRSHRRPR